MWTTRVIVVGVLVLATTTALCTNASVELGPSGEEDQAHCGLCHLVRARKEEKRNADHVDAWLRSGERKKGCRFILSTHSSSGFAAATVCVL